MGDDVTKVHLPIPRLFSYTLTCDTSELDFPMTMATLQ